MKADGYSIGATQVREALGKCVLVMFAIACGERGTVADTARPVLRTPSSARESAQYDDTISIALREDSIEKYFAAHPAQVKMFAAVSEKAELVPVIDTTAWPEDTETSYNTGVDSTGRPLFHAQVPVSQSGDWFAVETHYFAPDGRTILHQYRIAGFSSGCGDVLREIKRTFLGPTGATLAETRTFTDGNERPVNADNCYRRSDDAPAPRRTAAELPFLPRE